MVRNKKFTEQKDEMNVTIDVNKMNESKSGRERERGKSFQTGTHTFIFTHERAF